MAIAASPISTLFSSDSTFIIPLVPSKVTLQLNPSYADVRNNIDKWCVDYVNPQSGIKKAWVIDGKYGLHTAYNYPTAPAEQLESVAKFTACTFFVDDDIDRQQSAAGRIKALISHHKNILEGCYNGNGLDLPPTLIRRLHMFDDLWREVLRGMTSNQQERMYRHMNESFDLSSTELEWVKFGEVPATDMFMELRRRASAVMPSFILIEYACNIDVGTKALLHEHIQTIERIGVDHVMLANDLASFNKEWADGGYLNMVPIFAYNNQCSLQEAVNATSKMVEDLEIEYLRLKGVVEATKELATVPGLLQYVDGIGSWISGNQEWGWVTARYNKKPPCYPGSIISLNKYACNVPR